ncbi:MAG: hypothetical protein KJ737_25515 [Proteobacteria bacterium]|nr:hypothetical protein [Pseudomonadota bacterium]
MFPFSFEWVWDMGHYVFLGGMWYAIGIISLGLTYCIGKTILDMVSGKGGGHGDHH